MTGRLGSQQQTLWIICLLFIATAAEESPCPEGGRVHLDSWRCYWLSETPSSWPGAQDSCRETHGGDLASAESPELQRFMHSSFPATNTVWVWLRGDQALEQASPGQESQELCSQMALGTLGQWRKVRCAGIHLFLCEKEVTESLPPVGTFLTGLVLMTGVYAHTQIQPLTSVPDTGQATVEMQLFPGLWFSHAGQLVSVELVVQSSPISSVARVQILRPYCSPHHHLVPPGCSFLLNPFSCCSAVPLCNTTGGCSLGQYWCHLTEACVRTTSPCSPYDAAAGGRFALPPRYITIPPFYHLVADLPLRVNPSSDAKTISVLLPDRAIMVYPDDIVALQHTRPSGRFLHCLSGRSTEELPWRQSYLSLRGTEWGGWWEGGLTSLPPGGRWVDGVVCDLRMLFVDNLHRGTEHDGYFGETTSAPERWVLTTSPTPIQRSNFRLHVICPEPDEKNQIHIQINVPTVVIVKVLHGERAKSSWSGPVLQTGVPFLPSCPEEVVESCHGCRRRSDDEWFSSVTLMLPSVGSKTLNISVMDAGASQSVSVKVWSHEAVTGLSVEPHGCLRILVETPQSFIGKVESGSSVKFTWVIDNLDKFAHEGESYSVVFKKPAEYKLKVTASNPVSSQVQEILLTADEVTPLAELVFLSPREAVAVDATNIYTLRVRADISLPVTFSWDFGDGSGKVIHTQPAPCQTMGKVLKKNKKQVDIQHSVNYTYSDLDDYSLYVKVSNQYGSIDASMKISVRPPLHLLLISSPLPVALVRQSFPLEASVRPSTYAVVYTWDFGDGSEAVTAARHEVNHTFTCAGVYNITVSANNSLSVLTSWLAVDVMEEISGLTVSHDGSTELGTSTGFRAAVATGTSLRWSFNFGDGSMLGNLTNGSISHIYKSPGNYRVNLTVSNSAGQAQQSVAVEVYRLVVRGVLPMECVIGGKDVQFTALVNGDVASLTFHWLFGHGSPPTIVKGKPTTVHRFQSEGTFLISLGVFSSVTSVFFNTSVCVEPEIANVTVQSSQEVVAVGEEVCLRVLVFPEQQTGYLVKWTSSASSVVSRAENSQQCFIFQDEGVEDVSVTVRNRVSNHTAQARVAIQRPVGNLSVAHDGHSETLMVNTLISFWVSSCVGTNVSTLWDFGDGSSSEEKQNVSHVFTSTGLFTVTATAFNSVSRCSVTLKVRVLLPVSDFSLHTDEPYAAVGEETLISATGNTIGTNYYWTVDGMTSSQKRTHQFRFTFPRPGIYQVRVVAQNLVSRKEAAISVEVLERIDGLRIESESWTNMKYVATREKLFFTAAATKGSGIIYHWFATQTGTRGPITGDGGLFSLLTEHPGEISLHLRASNRLGETTSVVSLMAVQRVTGAHITTRSNVLALGRAVNISVSVTSGSHLHYLWYMNSNVSPVQTREPVLLHTFTRLGRCVVRVSAQNMLGQSNTSKEFIVQEEVQKVAFEIEGKTHPFYIPTGHAVELCGFTQYGSDLKWSWEVRDAEKQVFNITNQMFVHSFPRAGIYEVSLNVSNAINWQMVSHGVTVQNAIKDLLLDMSKSSTCTEEQVTFTPTVSDGSNESFVITFQSKAWTHSQDVVGGQFTTSSLPAGNYLVTVKAWNQVSNAEVSSSLLVKENIQGLHLVNCCSAALEALKGSYFRAGVQSGLPVNYTWRFHLVGSDSTELTGQEVVFTPAQSGLLSVSVVATNGVCSRAVNSTVSVERPVKKVILRRDSERMFVGHAVTFSAHVNEGSDLTFLWDFGDSTEVFMTDLHRVSHTYYIPGKYRAQVKVQNRVSRVSTHINVEVEELRCSSPRASIVQSQSTIFRSRTSFFEASVDINCSAYKTTYLWEIFKQSDCTNTIVTFPRNKVGLGERVDATLPFLLLPKHALHVGRYCLAFTVSLQGTPLLLLQQTAITVVHSPLVAVIQGGSHRLWSSLSDLVLDGSESHDPDVESGGDSALQYEWNLMEKLSSTESQFVQKPIGNNNSRETVSSTYLHPGAVYVFTLTVNKPGRRAASVNQTVSVTGSPVLPVSVECVSCSPLSSPHHASYARPIVLSGQCKQCEQPQYIWSAEDQSGSALDLTRVITSSGRSSSPSLELDSDVLQPGQSYTFTLNMSQLDGGLWGSASLTILPNQPPLGGLCDLSPESDILLLETVVTYNCTGWEDEETSQLIYTLQVAPCQTADSACSLLTLYRGTRPMFGSLVPMGSIGPERGASVITVTLLVEDHLGAKVVALKRMLTVRNPVRDEVTSQWLRNKSQTELWALVQHGNPQQIIPYSIALTSQLNQMESRPGARELRDRREIRQNVTRAVASLPVSSMLDVDQISSALSQSTAVPDELLCGSCQGKVLEAVGKMIRVMEEQMSPGVSSAVGAGRKLFSIIGSTLAAVSESASAPSLGPVYSSSSLALSALTHTGALMRSMMRSQIRDAPPLALSSPYLHTVGYHGDPSHLLCSSQSDQSVPPSPLPCQFHIPSSVSSQLKEQGSGVVQVLFGLGAGLGSGPLLAPARPPISTGLVAMELSTPGGDPIPIQDLDPEQAIRVTLPGTYHLGQEDEGGDGSRPGGGNGTCLTVALPEEGSLNLTVKAVDGLDENAGLYISFSFSLDPGATPVSLGHVRVDVSSSVPETNASQDSLVREWVLALSSTSPSTEESIFLTPLLNGSDGPLSVGLTSSLGGGGPVRVSACVFSSLCRFYSVEERRWSSRGLLPLEGSTLRAARCLSRHLTVFGASLFVHPGAVLLLPPPGGPMRNTVAAIVCAVLVLIHLLVGLIAHKLDHLDSLRLSQVPLCGRPGLFHYRVLVKTGLRRGAGTTAHVGISLYGVNKSGSRHLQRDGAFQRGGLDQFHLETDDDLGEVWKIRIWHDNTGLDPSWYVQHVVVWDPQSDHMFFFLLDDWLSVENQRNGTVEKEVLASCPEELSQFGRVFSSQLLFGMVERHLWLSLWERPAHSLFTRAQRVTCSALVLHLYLAVGALWYGAVGTQGQSGPVWDQLLVDVEAVAAGTTTAVLVFPLQCLLCFLFRKAHSQVAVDMSVPPSPVCHSVEMDIYLGQSGLSGPSFLSLPDSSRPAGDSPSSLLESKAFDSSILDFWSGLAQQTDGACREEAVSTWPSCDSLLNLPLAPSVPEASPAPGPIRLLRRKKALLQLCLQSSSSPSSPAAPLPPPPPPPPPPPLEREVSKLVQSQSHNLTSLLTLSDEDLLMSIAAAAEDTEHKTSSSSDSGRDSPRTTSSLSNTHSTGCSSWSEHSEDRSLYGAELAPRPDPQAPLVGLHRCDSVDSVASTVLPSPSPDSSHSSPSTRIGVARAPPGWLLPPWTLGAVYPGLALLLSACLAVVGLYGSFLSRAAVLRWLLSSLCAFLTSALLLEPLKVCVQGLILTAVWRPVDPEVEDLLAQDTSVVRPFGEHSGKVRPPCGFGLLQAKEEARKVRALRSLMRHCVCQLLFLMLVLMLNYQGGVEHTHARLLRSALRRQLHRASPGVPERTTLSSWSEAERWLRHTVVSHLHLNSSGQPVGPGRLQYTHGVCVESVILGDSRAATQQILDGLHMASWSQTQYKSLLIDFTHRHRESGLFVCVSIRLEAAPLKTLSQSVSIHPLLIPSSSSGVDLQLALTALLLLSALLILSGELWAVATERAQYVHQWRHWFPLLLASLSLGTAVLHLCFLSEASACLNKRQSHPDDFISFQHVVLLDQRASQSSAVLLTLLVLKLLGTLRFVRRWLVLGRVLQRAWRELRAVSVLLLLLLLLLAHLGHVLFSRSVEDFLSVPGSGGSLLSVLKGRKLLRRLCRVHALLGPLYGLLVVGGVWILARLCGAVLIHTYRAEQAELFRPTIEPQDYEMVEFFIKRLKLWMGLTKAKEFRHRVKFEGMDMPPSRSSQESRLSTLSSSLRSSRSPSSRASSLSSPRPPSSSLSTRSEDSSGVSEPGLDVQPHLERLLPGLAALLSRFDQVNQAAQDVLDLEEKLEEARARRRRRWMAKQEESAKPKESESKDRTETGDVRHRRLGVFHPRPQLPLPSSSIPSTPSTLIQPAVITSVFPRTRSTHSESESGSSRWEAAHPGPGSGPAGPPGAGMFPRRRAWHSGSSHSADAAQRILSIQDAERLAFPSCRPRSEEGVRARLRDAAPVKRKAWTSEGSETEQD